MLFGGAEGEDTLLRDVLKAVGPSTVSRNLTMSRVLLTNIDV